MSHWYWLASYPKSGNTWFRAFMANLRSESEEAVDINDMHGTPIASARAFFEEHLPIPTGDLSHDEIDAFRPLVYRHIAATSEEPQVYSKVHDAWLANAAGEPMFPQDVTAGALYLVRHPFDVAASYANHNGCTVERAVRMMNDPQHALCAASDRALNQMRQRMGSWSDHVQSWLDAPIPVHVVRYEDMKSDPVTTFTDAAAFLRLPHDPDLVAEALEKCRFERLQAQENEAGFKEKSPRSPSFFRSGKVGGWRDDVSVEQAARLAQVHQGMMDRLGYEVPDDVAQALSGLPELAQP